MRFVNPVVLILPLFLCLAACGEQEKGDSGGEDQHHDGPHWRYFDRELYFPQGISVDAEKSAAQQIVKDALLELESATDLGVDYFIFLSEEDSLLQPISEQTDAEGRPWMSFFQSWDDDLINGQMAGNGASAGDQDLIVATNKSNNREFYIVARASCFVSGTSCYHPSQKQARALVWRAFGYLIGLRDGENAASAIMKPGIYREQEDPEQARKFFAEFNGQLERIRNNLPVDNIRGDSQK